ncbi:MAG: PAS domain-containing sensor histidine kinase [Saprospiraceae bacterium]
MNLFEKKSRWKLYLAIAGLVIVIISTVVSNYLSVRLIEGERQDAEDLLIAFQVINDLESTPDQINNASSKIVGNETIPLILVDPRNEIITAKNFGESRDTNFTYLEQQLQSIINSGREPLEVEGFGQKIYYKDSWLLTMLTYFPYFQLFLVGSFVAMGYIFLNSARRAEQNQVWVGMAKETAHQLGTPISAILGWIDHLRMMKGEDEETMEIVDELRNDVTRLELIADRFSKIGSEPVLKPINIYSELEECRAYMQRRAPRKVAFDFPDPQTQSLFVNINGPLFDWVIENLLRNAVDAMPTGKGKITAVVYSDPDSVYIDVSDTGNGIPPSKHKTVFEPGFTTKKRGWGLGLSLAKRIIESYHSGKIFVKKSVEGEGTTFTIKLPKTINSLEHSGL